MNKLSMCVHKAINCGCFGPLLVLLEAKLWFPLELHAKSASWFASLQTNYEFKVGSFSFCNRHLLKVPPPIEYCIP